MLKGNIFHHCHTRNVTWQKLRCACIAKNWWQQMRSSSDLDSLHLLRHVFMTSQSNYRENTQKLELFVL